jgi:hypothetical protein
MMEKGPTPEKGVHGEYDPCVGMLFDDGEIGKEAP